LVRAVELLAEAIRIDDSFAAAYGQLAVACSLCEAYGYHCDADIVARANDFANRAIDLDPGSSQAHMSMFFTLRRMDIRRAISEVRTATALDGSNSEAYHYLAHSLVFCGHYMSAEKAELAANRLDPFMEMSDALLSRIYFLTGQDAKLKKLDQAMTRKYSQSHVLYSTRGWIDWCSRRWESAAENYRKALAKVPSDDLLIDHLADCNIRLGNIEYAIEILKRQLSESEGANMIRTRLGQAYAAGGAEDSAEEQFAKAASGVRSWMSHHRGVGSALHHFQTAYLYGLKGDRAATIENLRAAIERGYGNYAELRVRPDWDILRGDKEFESIIQDLEDQKKSEDIG
jgi:tetratricopeptide (TPR) repeat protein